ncbi:phenylacetate--CoA ligase family protein [Thauera mechernichensis]|uniref:Phenylacetate--CoA ligase family protein n=1 Tax=Thauera mechernichensis TaxID=82788 RepID=A0ABW3WHU8_9RHOO|nr:MULTISPECIES: AMP-binding protein [Thauera]MDG3063447.1 AMP-binding protein [Thauera mechernichensis]WBL63431.1 AMP-binding protein [Thauera sp. WB-2]HNR62103.1 AMP-binding protein [Thauera sp.]HNS93550.1 AMP-binding protein [Thauera sp.]HRK10342.1 AMP-binding protein [Thauera sp.]
MTFYDDRETLPADARERALLARLPGQIAHARASAPAFSRLLEDVDPDTIISREALATLPVTRKSELLEQQKAARPFGGFAAVGWGAACRRVFASPGPLYEPEGARPDYYRLARALHAAGFRAGDLVHNTFSYHFTPAGSMMETAAHALGCTVFPAGVGQTEQQLAAIVDLQPNAYVGTPSFLRILLEKADEAGLRPSFTKAFVSGEAFPPSVRDAFAARGIQAYQAYATADIGLIAYETPAREGLVVDEDILLEIVRPGTGDPVPEGEVGEVVVTTFNPDYPLIRFGTGDLSAVLPGASPCGRTNLRIKGWMGRADQTTKVKGMFVHPGQIADVVRRHAEIRRARLVVDNPDLNDRMTLMCEVAGGGSEALAAAVASSIRELTKLRGEVAFLPSGALANDGKVIDDVRVYN